MDAKGIVKAATAFEETASGLHVPSHVAQEVAKEKVDAARTSVRWGYDTWKRLRRLVSEMGKSDPPVMLMPVCSKCKEMIGIVMLDGSKVVDPDDRKLVNRMALRCTCTDRVVVYGV